MTTNKRRNKTLSEKAKLIEWLHNETYKSLETLADAIGIASPGISDRATELTRQDQSKEKAFKTAVIEAAKARLQAPDDPTTTA